MDGSPTMLDVMSLDVVELEVIDLADPGRSTPGATTDWRSFEERYATLAFGLGTVPRRQHPDDPLWQRPAGLLIGRRHPAQLPDAPEHRPLAAPRRSRPGRSHWPGHDGRADRFGVSWIS